MSPPDTPEPSVESRPSRRWLPIALVLVLALAVVAGVRALLPLGVARTLEGQLSEALGRPVRVADVDLALLRGGIALRSVAVGARGAEAPPESEPAGDSLLRADRLFARLSWRDLVRRRVRVSELVADGLALRLVQEEDGRLEPLVLGAEQAGPGGEAASGQAWPVRMDRVVLRDARLRLDSADASPPLELRVARIVLADVIPSEDGLFLGALEVREPTLRLHRDWTPPPGDEPDGAGESNSPDAAAAPVRLGRLAVEGGRLVVLDEGEPFEAGFELSGSELSARADARFPLELAVTVEQGRAELAGAAGLLPVAFEGTLRLRELPLAPVVRAATGDPNGPLRAGRASGELALTVGAGSGGAGGAGSGGAGGDELRASGRIALDALALADRGSFGLGWTRLEADVAEVRLPLTGGSGRLVLDRLLVELPSLRWVRSAAEAAASGHGEQEDSGLEFAIAKLELVDGSLDFEDRSVDPPFRARAEHVTAHASALAWPDGRASELRASGSVFESGSLAARGGFEASKGELRLELAGVGLPPLNPYVAPAGYRFGAGVFSLDSVVRIRGDRVESNNDLRLRNLAVEGPSDGWLERNLGLSLDLALALLRDPKGGIRLSLPVTWEAGGGGAGFGRALQSAFRQAIVGAVSTPLKLVGAAFSAQGAQVIRFDAIDARAGGSDLTERGEARLASLAALLEERPQLGVRLRGRAGPSDRIALAEGGDADAVPSERLDALAGARAERVRELLAARGVGTRRLEIGKPVPPGGPGVDVEFFAVGS